VLYVGPSAESIFRFRIPFLRKCVLRGMRVSVASSGFSRQHYDVASIESFNIIAISQHRTSIRLSALISDLVDLASIIKNTRPTVVIAGGVRNIFLCSFVSYFVKSPHYVHHYTGLGALVSLDGLRVKVTGTLVFQFIRISMRHVRCVIFQNPDDRRYLQERGIINASRDVSRIILGSGVDLNQYLFSETPASSIKFLFIGRLLQEKGIIDFVQSVVLFHKRNPSTDVSFEVLGGEDIKVGSITQSELYSIAGGDCKLKFLGQVEDVRPYIRDAHCVVLPSYREGIPRAILEAMSIGRAIITTDAPGCRETVTDGYNGFLVPVRSPVELCLAFERYIVAPNRDKMGRRSRELVEGQFDARLIADQMWDVLENDVLS
jgi:glycosyltransferase involved in cell wall biosynthesis